MANMNNRGAALRVTALTAALLGVYGVAGATPATVDDCVNATCSADGQALVAGASKPVVQGRDNAVVNITGGSIKGNGPGEKGVLSMTGSTITVDNVKSFTTTNAHAIQAFDVNGNGSTVIVNGSNINTTGVGYALGIQAYDKGFVSGANNTITTTGANGSGVEAQRGGVISLQKTNINTQGASAAGARAYSGVPGAKGTISLREVHITTVSGTGLLAGDNDGGGQSTAGDITFTNGTVKARGSAVSDEPQYAVGSAAVVQGKSSLIVDNSDLQSELRHGLAIRNADSTANIINTSLSTAGKGASTSTLISGITASDAANVTVTGGSIAATGDTFTRGILATSAATVTTTGTAISTKGSNSHAVHAWGPSGNSDHKHALTPTIHINGGTIIVSGEESYGLSAQNGATINSSAVITTSGPAGFGAFGYNGGNITLNGGSINTSGAIFFHPTLKVDVGSYGVLSKNKSNVHLDGTVITTTGALGEGLRAESESEGETTGSHITANNVTIRTSGDTAHGVSARGFASSVKMTNGSIAATGANSAGAFLRNRADITLNNVKVVSAGPSIISSARHTTRQEINIGSGSDLSVNNGTLLLVKRETGGEEAKVTLNLNAGSFASGNIVNHDNDGKLADGTGRTILNVSKNAHWAGIVVGAGDKIVEEGATATYGDVTGNVVPAPNSTVTFTPGAQITGSVSAAQGSTTTFTGNSTITEGVASQGGAMVFGGNATIGSSVTATQGSSFSFGGTTQIGRPGSTDTAMAGQGASFGFSRTAPTTIHGNVVLTQGSSVSGGSSDAPVQIVGNTSISDGARLGGNLIISGQLAAAGGVVSPGNSIGTVRVGSVASFPSTYAVEVNGAGASDLMIVDSGDVNLSASALTVGQENGNGGYVLNHDYTIIQMPGNTATTKFDSATLDDSFANTLVKLDPVKYSKTDVKIALSPDTSKVSAKRSGLSANQNATLDGVISVAGRNASADAALLSTETGAALNQLSGELHGSTQSALLNSSSLLTNTISKRMRGNVGSGMMAGAPVAQSSGSVPAGAMPTSAAYPLWAEVVGNWSSLDGDNNAAKVKSDTAGLFLGGDVGMGKGWRLGAALGFTDGKIKVNDRNSRSDVRSYTAAIYGGNSWATAKGSVNFLAGAGYTRHNVDSRRTVTIGGNQTLKADYKANTTHLFTELGYAMPVGKASVVEPYLGLAWISQRAKDFSESGGSAALSGQSQTDNITTFTLGARGKTTVEAGRHEIRLSAGAGWRHASGDVDATRKMSFIQGNGATFQVAGAPIAKNAAVVDLGAEATIGKNAAMGLAYTGQFGNGNTDSTGSLYLKFRFK